MKRKFKRHLKNFDAVEERILKINMDIFGRRITILGIYAPHNEEINGVKDMFYQKLQKVIDEIEVTR